MIENHGVPVEIGESNEAIPVHFAYRRDMNIEVAASAGRKSPVDRPPLRDVFDTPDLAAMDDAIANGTLQRLPGAPEPLALFPAARVDYSLYRRPVLYLSACPRCRPFIWLSLAIEASP